ncbi:MAG: hypothetical protein EAZ76_00830 [Nostocales cyanobacterium]|nr:MAG: hypothetical protein EAZ87_02780 [Nostocales cyanobacterium]TAF21014.1 MAG: hypothetical protein EAZ76_00830 [Nostocales cyanobacterium]
MKPILNTTVLTAITLLSWQIITTKTLAQEVRKDSTIPSEKDAIALMQNICGAGNIVKEQGRIGCKKCPSFTRYSGDSGGSLTSVVYGSFTKAGSREALVDLGDCEPRVSNWGGSVLLRRTNQGLSRIRYEQGLRSHSCLKVPNKTGRDSLVCEGSYTGQGYFITWLEHIELGTTKTKNINLLKVESNTATCRPPFYAVGIQDFMLQDTNQDRLADLVVKVTEAREPKDTTRSSDDQCEPKLSESKLHQLTFLNNGQSFQATPNTAHLIKQFGFVE